MSLPSWSPLKRNYENEIKAHSIKRSDASMSHPLLVARVQAVKVEDYNARKASISTKGGVNPPKPPPATDDPLSSSSSDFDPLSAAADDIDPLTAMAMGLPSSAGGGSGSARSAPTSTAAKADSKIENETPEKVTKTINWSIARQEIIKDFAFTGNITFDRSAMDDFAGSGVEDGSRSGRVNNDKYAKRLAALENKNKAESTVSYSLEQFISHISNLTADLNTAWANDERVQSLKIVIQISKILSDTSGPQFYPYVFALIVDVLDKFGDMVYTRLKNKADEALSEGDPKGKLKLSADFSDKDVPQICKDTCRNWFFKCACVRELIPRLYMEMTLIRSYRFIIPDAEFPAILSRMANIIRGIGNPLVSLYARVYLIKVGYLVAPKETKHYLSLTQDLLASHKMVIDPALNKFALEQSRMSVKDYTRCLSPAIKWIIQHCGRDASKETFQQVLFLFKEQCKDAMVLKHIIDSFDSKFYCEKATGMSSLIKTVAPSCCTVADVYAAFGQQLLINPPPQDQRVPLLNDAWRTVSKVDDLGSYINSAFCWLATIGAHYSEKEALVLLNDISTRVQASFTNNDYFSDTILRQLEAIINIFINSPTMCDVVLTSEHLMKLLDVFKGVKKVEICKDIMVAFKKHPPTNDAILINTLFDIGRVLHDSIDFLSPEGEKKNIANLIGCFIDKIDFGKEMENQLNMYVECRAIFCNLDTIKDKLVMCVSLLASKILKFVKGKHSKKTSGFVKACLAYCHITIPSIADAFRRLQLLIHCALVAVSNQCLPQTDTLLKAAISVIPELPPFEEIDGKRLHSEDKVASNIRYLLAVLVVTPGHPEHGPFYIVKGLFNALPKFPWQSNSACQARLYCEIIALMCTFAQKKLPYKILNVESNDDLYCGNSEYLSDLNETLTTAAEEVLKAMTALKDSTDAATKANMVKIILDFVNQICERMDMTKDTCDFVNNLLSLGNKSNDKLSNQDRKYWTNTIEIVKAKCRDTSDAQGLLNNLKSM